MIPLVADAVYPVLQLSVKGPPVAPADVGLTDEEAVTLWLPEHVFTLHEGLLAQTLLISHSIVPLAADSVCPVLQLSVKESPVWPPEVGLTEVEPVIVWLPEHVLALHEGLLVQTLPPSHSIVPLAADIV